MEVPWNVPFDEADARKAATEEASKVAPVFGMIMVEEDGQETEKEVQIAKNGKITPEGEIWLTQEQKRITMKAEKSAANRIDKVSAWLNLRPDAGTATGGSPSDKRVTAQAKKEGDTDYAPEGG